MLTVKGRPLVKFFQYTGIFSVSRGSPRATNKVDQISHHLSSSKCHFSMYLRPISMSYDHLQVEGMPSTIVFCYHYSFGYEVRDHGAVVPLQSDFKARNYSK